STLLIQSAQDEHTGNYTCLASNSARTATITATLSVSVPPSWILEPSSRSVALGGTVIFNCLAKGFPKPTMLWKRETESHKFVNLMVSDGEVSYWENGTMKINSVEQRHEGRYICEANNGVGAGLSKVVTLNVNEPPWFSVRSHRKQAMVGDTTTLSCEAKGDKPLKLSWSKDKAPLPSLMRYDISERETDYVSITELVIRSTLVGDSGHYICTANNDHGSLTSDFQLLVQDVPGPPTSVTVAEDGSRYLTLSWTPPPDSNAPIKAYIVTYHQQNNDLHSVPSDGREVTVEGDERRVRIEGLRPAGSYVFSVVAENRVGRSQVSSPLTANTHEEPPEGMPINIRVTSLSSTALSVSWDPPQE
ncbi:unnamed protein product, partial [Meganyctiphanes norvegica]